MIIVSGGFVEFFFIVEIVRVENCCYVEIDEKGNFLFVIVIVERNFKLIFSCVVSYVLILRCFEFRIKYEGLMIMNYGYIYFVFVWIESEGILILDGIGFGLEEGVG